MFSRNINIWLLCAVAVIAAACSGVRNVEKLSTYWEGHDFASLDGFSDIDEAEDKFDGYISLLSKVPQDVAAHNLTDFLDSAAQNVVGYMVWSGWLEPYLHALQSPYKNDALFVVFLDKVLADNVIDDGSMMEHLQHLRLMMDKNRVGMTPEDLVLRDEAGEKFMLSTALAGKSTLLLFVDANCPSCLQSLEENVGEYAKKDVRLMAILVNGSHYHLVNIRKQLPESVLAPWTFACVSQTTLEEDGLYDSSLLPFRMLVSKDGIIEKSYN